MTDRPDIIELIDNAVEDFGLSDDAMRWTPEPSTRPAGLGVEPTYTIIDETHVWSPEMARTFRVLLDRAYREMEPPSLGFALTPLQAAARPALLATPPEELARSSRDVERFVTEGLGVELTDWQRDVLRSLDFGVA